MIPEPLPLGIPRRHEISHLVKLDLPGVERSSHVLLISFQPFVSRYHLPLLYYLIQAFRSKIHDLWMLNGPAQLHAPMLLRRCYQHAVGGIIKP